MHLGYICSVFVFALLTRTIISDLYDETRMPMKVFPRLAVPCLQKRTLPLSPRFLLSYSRAVAGRSFGGTLQNLEEGGEGWITAVSYPGH